MRKIWIVLVMVVAALVAAPTAPAFQGSADLVEWDALEAGKYYMIRTTVHAQASYQTRRLGVWYFQGGGMFKIHERRFHDRGSLVSSKVDQAGDHRRQRGHPRMDQGRWPARAWGL